MLELIDSGKRLVVRERFYRHFRPPCDSHRRQVCTDYDRPADIQRDSVRGRMRREPSIQMAAQSRPDLYDRSVVEK